MIYVEQNYDQDEGKRWWLLPSVPPPPFLLHSNYLQAKAALKFFSDRWTLKEKPIKLVVFFFKYPWNWLIFPEALEDEISTCWLLHWEQMNYLFNRLRPTRAPHGLLQLWEEFNFDFLYWVLTRVVQFLENMSLVFSLVS